VRNTPERDPLPYGVPAPRFRLPDGARVGGVHLQVSDLRRAVEYYEQVIGLGAQHRDDERVALSAADDRAPLVTLSTRPGVTRARRGAFGLYHFAILLPDRAALGRFAAHLAQLGVRAGMADHLVSEALYLWDPDGLGIEVYADRPRETWRGQGPELAMTSDPLDLESVIAAGGGEPWTGTPVGTTVGHVHLHVGRLDQAEAFYHRALGFDKTVWSYPGALFMSAGGYHHHLGTNVWSAGPGPSRDEAQLLEWELLVPSARPRTAPNP
jgi:catechol 2,3-dioxygenase